MSSFNYHTFLKPIFQLKCCISLNTFGPFSFSETIRRRFNQLNVGLFHEDEPSTSSKALWRSQRKRDAAETKRVFADVHSLRFVTSLSKQHRVHNPKACAHSRAGESDPPPAGGKRTQRLRRSLCPCVCVSGGVNVLVCGYRTLAEIRACSPAYIFQTLMILCVFCDIGGHIQNTKTEDTFAKFRSGGGGSLVIIKD